MTALGHPHLHLRATDSTNLRARELAARGASHGALVTADLQTAGRGRQGRGWTAPARRALLMSVIIRRVPPLLSLRAGIAVARTAEALDAARRPAAVKWPNDVQLDGRKVAGILVEGRPQDGWAVLGIGLNVALAPEDLGPDLSARVASLGRPADDVPVALESVLEELEPVMTADRADVLQRLRARDALRGQRVSWAGGEGTGAGIDDDGRLLVRCAGRTLALDAGEVHLHAINRDAGRDR